MNKYKYKLTLEVKDHGIRTFTAEGEFDSQSDMQSDIPFYIAKALRSTMHSPPNPMQMAGAIEGDCWSLIAGLAYAHEKWDGDLIFDECISIIVDVDKLCGTDDANRKDGIKGMLERHGIEIKK